MEDLTPLATRRLPTKWLGRPLVLKAETGSTNDDARTAAQAGAASGLTIVADSQTSGRGRRGRSWHSPPGDSLYLSVVVRSSMRPDVAPLLTLAAGLAVRDAVAHFVAPERVTIKWPNDVRIDRKKVAGILVEGAIRGDALAYAVLGIGLNVRGASLPDELRERATTLRIARGADIARPEVLCALLVALESRIDAVVRAPAEIVGEVSRCCDTLGTEVQIDGVAGRAESLSPTGGIVIVTAAGERVEMRSGEIVEVA